MYIKYKLSRGSPTSQPNTISPYTAPTWKLLCLFFGHPKLDVEETDLVYGGSGKDKRDMRETTRLYFEDLVRKGVVTSYYYEVAKNPNYII